MRSCLRHCYRLLYLRMIIVLCSILEAAGAAQSPPTLGICSGPPWNRMKQPQFSKSRCLALPNNQAGKTATQRLASCLVE